ncbi:hypothetical protein FSP39_017431 [Pinctada imbricata]|uniref:CCHC-type domain-containing protein n=1 Tax=Pinctada imbricata TaxID=66713 RepID=A0AA88Y5T6_PINIB|nr:hypothetical protein FSP39_017431 [Pinctada imbricata]
MAGRRRKGKRRSNSSRQSMSPLSSRDPSPGVTKPAKEDQSALRDDSSHFSTGSVPVCTGSNYTSFPSSHLSTGSVPVCTGSNYTSFPSPSTTGSVPVCTGSNFTSFSSQNPSTGSVPVCTGSSITSFPTSHTFTGSVPVHTNQMHGSIPSTHVTGPDPVFIVPRCTNSPVPSYRAMPQLDGPYYTRSFTGSVPVDRNSVPVPVHSTAGVPISSNVAQISNLPVHSTGFVPVTSTQHINPSTCSTFYPRSSTSSVLVDSHYQTVPLVPGAVGYTNFHQPHPTTFDQATFQSGNGSPYNRNADLPLGAMHGDQQGADNSWQQAFCSLAKQMQDLQAVINRIISAQTTDNSQSETENENNNKRLSLSGWSNETSDEASDSCTSRTRPQRAKASKKFGKLKLPPFTGKEEWKVWIRRFEDVAERRDWTDAEKLDEILPRMHEMAGDFVFGQLDKSVRRRYSLLVAELGNRFRVVETCKTYGAKFSSRNQKPGETVENYAAELKRLYDKAHPRRNRQTRDEDLLRRFLDGLSDDKAQFHVEYVKDPANIDEAVFQVVNFNETGRKQETKTSKIREVNDESNDQGPTKSQRRNKGKGRENIKQVNVNMDMQKTISELRKQVEELKRDRDDRQRDNHNYDPNVPPYMYHMPPPPLLMKQPPQILKREMRPGVICFKCGGPGHFARECLSERPGDRPVQQPSYQRNVTERTSVQCEVKNIAGTSARVQSIIDVITSSTLTCPSGTDDRGTLWDTTAEEAYDVKNCTSGFVGKTKCICTARLTILIETYIIFLAHRSEAQSKHLREGIQIKTEESLLGELARLTKNSTNLYEPDIDISVDTLNNFVGLAEEVEDTVTDLSLESFLRCTSNLLDEANAPKWKAMLLKEKKGASRLMRYVSKYGKVSSRKTKQLRNIEQNNLIFQGGLTRPRYIKFPEILPDWLEEDRSSKVIIKKATIEGIQEKDITPAEFPKVLPIIMNTFVDNLKEENNMKVSDYGRSIVNHPSLNSEIWIPFSQRKEGTSNNIRLQNAKHIIPTARDAKGTRNTKSHRNIKHKLLHINQRDQWAVGAWNTEMSILKEVQNVQWESVVKDIEDILDVNSAVLDVTFDSVSRNLDPPIRLELKHFSELCTAVAVFLHYILLVVFFIMLGEGVEMAVSILYVLPTRSRKHWLIPLCWVLPLVIVGISVGVTKLKGYGNDISYV